MEVSSVEVGQRTAEDRHAVTPPNPPHPHPCSPSQPDPPALTLYVRTAFALEDMVLGSRIRTAAF